MINTKPMQKSAGTDTPHKEALEVDTNQVSAIADSHEQTGDLAKKEAQKAAETGTIFNKMFKKKNESAPDGKDS